MKKRMQKVYQSLTQKKLLDFSIKKKKNIKIKKI